MTPGQTAPPSPLQTPPVVGTGVKARPPVPPPSFSGNVQGVDEEGNPVIARLPRGRGTPEIVPGIRPAPRAGQKSPEQIQYESWLVQVNAEVTRTGRGNPRRAARMTSEQAIAERDDITRRVTGGKIPTYDELVRGSKGSVTPRGGRTGISRDEMSGFTDDLRRDMGLAPAAPVRPR